MRFPFLRINGKSFCGLIRREGIDFIINTKNLPIHEAARWEIRYVYSKKRSNFIKNYSVFIFHILYVISYQIFITFPFDNHLCLPVTDCDNRRSWDSVII